MAIYVTRIQHQSISCQLISCQSAQATLFRSQNRARRIARTSLWRRPSPVSASTNIILTSNFNKTALITNAINRILGKKHLKIYLFATQTKNLSTVFYNIITETPKKYSRVT